MSEKICPLIGGECLKDRCTWWIRISGKTPQDNEHIDLHDCAIAWFPILTLETTKAVRASNDALEQFRSETRKGMESFIGLMMRAAQRPVVAPPRDPDPPLRGNGSKALR